MEDTGALNNTSGFSMRRTVLTLLGAFFAFGVLTASYATAELPETPAAIQMGMQAR
ncbi:hypothetical protein [Aureimonas sp. AU4]|uniref:hypothetical protein n=1 Tax=Aureimonas sp. AU4 TaxID=1638163 RepID=UPI000A8EA27C|nr:hypothetical protein [Aureimonas sp. AU4]